MLILRVILFNLFLPVHLSLQRSTGSTISKQVLGHGAAERPFAEPLVKEVKGSYFLKFQGRNLSNYFIRFDLRQG